MLELPEIRRLAEQCDRELKGRRVNCLALGDKPHKWFFLNKTEDEMAAILTGRQVVGALGQGKRLRIEFDSGAFLAFCEFGGLIRFHPAGAELPSTWHFLLRFVDGSALTVNVQGWGAMHVTAPDELLMNVCDEPAPDALCDCFNIPGFRRAVRSWPERDKKGVKALLVGHHAVWGLGNGYLHDVLFKAHILPERKPSDISDAEIETLFHAIQGVMQEATDQGGRDTEHDLYGEVGHYRPILDKRMKEEPCPACGGPIVRISYLGGSCYYCPGCQH